MQSLEARKAERAQRDEERKQRLIEEGAPASIVEGSDVTTLDDTQSEDNNPSTFDPDKASFMELKAYVEEKGETVTPGTSTEQLKERAKLLQQPKTDERQGNGGGGGWPA